MTFNDSEGFSQDIEQMLNKVEEKIKAIKTLNQPELDRLDWLEIEEKLKALETRDETDKQQFQERLNALEGQINLFNRRLYGILLTLVIICALLALFFDVL